MGKKHREDRKQLKRLATLVGVRENEFGELKVRMTKADARRLLIRRRQAYEAVEMEIVSKLTEAVALDIDKEVLGELFAIGQGA